MPERKTLLELYRVMVTARTCDEAIYRLGNRGQMDFGMWLSACGQEAAGAAAGLALRREDYLVTYYRGLPEQLAKGMQLKEMWAEWLGKTTGVCRGKGGGIHVIDPDCGVMLNSGIIGAGLPIAVGLSLAAQLRGDGRVTLCTFGDGSSNQGAFHEALNLASAWRLPVVFFCMNNRYAETTAFSKVSANDRVVDRAGPYRIPGTRVDGNDPVATFEAASEAVERARAGGGPSLVEAMTYRLKGHYYLDDMAYLPEGEMESARAADPVPAFRRWLAEHGHADEPELAEIDAAAELEVEEAHLYAISGPEPSIEELHRDVIGAGA